MFISVVLNTEYFKVAWRAQWYLKNLLHCKENEWILITHEYLREHFDEVQKDIAPRLFNDFEMRPFTAEEVMDVEQYFLPDELFEQIEQQYGSRTEMLFHLSETANPMLEEYLQGIIDNIKKKHPSERIDGVLYSLETWESVRRVCEKNEIPLIPYSFSAIRKPHGYRQTLYHANMNKYLYTTDEAAHRYNKYLSEGLSMPVFSHRELIGLIGKDRTLPLITMMNMAPVYEMGICTECFSITPQFFIHSRTTDDDIRYKCEQLYDKSSIVVRNHPQQVDYMQLDRSTTHNDPAAWILSCKRLATSRSQILLKVLLWNRTAVVEADTLGFAFMCEKDYSSVHVVDLKKLNYYLFCYLIPNDLMFSDEYWKWRLKNPTETEIYQRHIDFLIDKLNLPKSIITETDEPTRFRSILISRGCDEELINILLDNKHDFDIDYNTASSRIVINGKSYWRLNKLEDGVRHFHIELNEAADSIEFYPLDDVAGCAKLVSFNVNGNPQEISQHGDFKYMPKSVGHYTIQFPSSNSTKTIIDIKWAYMNNNDFLNACQ